MLENAIPMQDHEENEPMPASLTAADDDDAPRNVERSVKQARVPCLRSEIR